MAVREKADGSGILATGGDDKFVRLWNLSDLALKREFQVTNGVPQGVALLSDEKSVIYSASGAEAPTDIFKSNIETGETRKLLTLEKSQVTVRAAINDFLYNLEKQIILASAEDGETKKIFVFPEGIDVIAVSANAKWLSVADKKGKLFLVDLTTGKQKALENEKVEDLTRIAVSNDGQFIYTATFFAQLVQWDTSAQKSKTIADGFRGQASSLQLSVDGNYAIIGGNHHDIAIYEIKTGERVFYNNDIDSSDFYVTNSWMKGNRLIFTSDGGVMYDGIL
jgi:WD40 repeat protein